MAKICPDCGVEQEESYKFCKNCGAPLESKIVKEAEIVQINPADTEETKPEQEKSCPNCGNPVDKEKFCPKCGQKLDLQAQTIRASAYCRNCGSQIDAEAEICPKCGVRQKSPPAEDKNPLLALILSLIFPGLGQLYNGQNHKGILLIIVYILAFVLWALLIGLLLTPLIWLYGLYDAYTTAEHINNGEFTEDKLFGF